MLTQLDVEKFKSLYDVRIPLKKLNIFIGPNNSGKSSILQVLLFLRQSYEYQNLQYNNPFNFQGFSELIFNKRIEDIIQLTLKNEPSKKLDKSFRLLGFHENKIRTDFQISNETNKSVFRSHLLSKTIDEEIVLFNNKSPEKHPYFEKIRKNYQKIISGGSAGGNEWFRFSRSVGISKKGHLDRDRIMVIEALNASIVNLNSFYSDFFRNITFIPVERGSMEWSTQITGSMPKEIQTNDNGNSLFNALFHMIRREHSDRLLRIQKWTRDFGIHNLTPFPVEASTPSCGVETLQDYSHSSFQLISMGFGTRQVLFLIVKALLANNRSLILIEEPEIHLHPAYQVKIIDFLIELINNDEKQIMVTTHSEYLLLRLQNSILNGEIAKENVGIFYVDIKDGKTEVKELQFTKEGSFEMPGFYDVTQREYRDWLQLKAENSDE